VMRTPSPEGLEATMRPTAATMPANIRKTAAQ
jgi:hypothetical protein